MTVAQADAIIIMGAGAVGSYVGGMLSLAGEDVILLDVWPAHVEAIAAEGLIIDTVAAERPADIGKIKPESAPRRRRQASRNKTDRASSTGRTATPKYKKLENRHAGSKTEANAPEGADGQSRQAAPEQ